MIARWLDRLVLWLRERLVNPAVNDLLAAFTKELQVAFAETRHDADAHYLILRRDVADARSELVAAAQMAAFVERLDRMDARLAELTKTIRTRGPRHFDYEHRQ